MSLTVTAFNNWVLLTLACNVCYSLTPFRLKCLTIDYAEYKVRHPMVIEAGILNDLPNRNHVIIADSTP